MISKITDLIEMEKVIVIDDIIRLRSKTCTGKPMLASLAPNGDHRLYSAKDIESLVERAARIIHHRGLPAQKSRSSAPVIGLLAPSSLEYLMTACGLSRLGYTVLILSPRLSVTAYLTLLEETNCKILFSTSRSLETLSQIASAKTISTWNILRDDELHPRDGEDGLPPFEAPQIEPKGRELTAFIMHSSGSTGVPKPIHQTHQRYISNASNGTGLSAMMTLPLYHTYGLSQFYRLLCHGLLVILLDYSVPVTGGGVVKAIESMKPQQLCTVPYILKMVAETDGGFEALRSCRMVTYHGSPCPLELGTRITEEGVHLVGDLGSTEAGALATTQRPRGDQNWNYFRFLPSVKRHINMKPIGNGMFELVCLQSLSTKVLSNSEDPPGSLHTKDLFAPHPSLPEAWEYIGRLDDRITLLNGEKVLPLPIEGSIEHDPLVKEAVVFGIGKEVPGILIFKSSLAANMSEVEFVDHVWPAIQKANEKAEGFSQISKSLIIVFPSEVEFPKTDKGSLMRLVGYKKFEREIDTAYRNFDRSDGQLVLGMDEMLEYIRKLCCEQLELEIDVDSDLYAAGLDSMKAIQLASLVRKRLKLSAQRENFTASDIYDQGSLRKVAFYLCSTEIPQNQLSDIQEMQNLIDKYSDVETRIGQPASPRPQHHTVVLTGATGNLGAHLLFQLLQTPQVHRIFCLVRKSLASKPRDRVLTALEQRGLCVSPELWSKVVPLASDLSDVSLGLEHGILSQLRSSLTLVIHCAWPVNFNLAIKSFENDIKGVRNLINLSTSVGMSDPADFIFCSSISVAMRVPAPAIIAEGTIENLSFAQTTGYAQSKLVAEHLCQNAIKKGARCSVFRIGQIVGDGKTFDWNDTEAIPLMIRSAITLGKLPAIEEECSWLPVDILATAILEMSRVGTGFDTSCDQQLRGVYNLLNPLRFSWTEELLPALRKTALRFDTVEPWEWVGALKESGNNKTSEENPTLKLMRFFERKYGNANADTPKKNIVFKTEKSEERSPSLRRAPNMVQGGYVDGFVNQWLLKWQRN